MRERRPETKEAAAFSCYWTRDTTITIPLPIQLTNFEINWINSYLTNILGLISSVGKEVQEIGEEELNLFSKAIKASKYQILFLSSWLKDGKVTELYTALFFSGQWTEFIIVQSLDSKIRVKAVQDEVWETLISQLAKFCQILRMVKYKFINIQSIKRRKCSRAQYKALKPYYKSGLQMLASSSDRRLDGQTCRIPRPPGTCCIGCHGDLGGKEAQLVLKFNPDSKMTTPCVVDISDTAKNIVVCGQHEACCVRACGPGF